MARFFLTSLLSAGLLFACTTKEFDPDNPKKSFVIAKEPYDDGNYEIAINKLGEFKVLKLLSQSATFPLVVTIISPFGTKTFVSYLETFNS